ncbi:MAG: 30S ribosome-binding factor RbfA [Candidatus Moranbacteria bacterium]|nr:30S ribosome-binding factor RbfA [Candidatus Moranbacteria bacterium]
MSLRTQKVNSLISQEVSNIIAREIDLKPGVFVTIAKVDTTRDLRYSHIFISVFPESEIHYVEKTLEHELKTIQRKLNQKLHMKILPRLKFKIDTTEARADEIEKLLRQI